MSQSKSVCHRGDLNAKVYIYDVRNSKQALYQWANSKRALYKWGAEISVSSICFAPHDAAVWALANEVTNNMPKQYLGLHYFITV